jgi:DNA uptake protein ComE-like DNA-binding protein
VGLSSFLLFALPVLPLTVLHFSIAQAAEPLDINIATADQFKALPGIGDAYSKKIIEHQPYKRKDEVVQKEVIPQVTYDQIKDQIVAKHKKRR